MYYYVDRQDKLCVCVFVRVCVCVFVFVGEWVVVWKGIHKEGGGAIHRLKMEGVALFEVFS